MLALCLLVGLRLVSSSLGTDDDGLRKKVISVDVIEVGMGIDQGSDWLVSHSTDFRHQALCHSGIGKAVDHDYIPVANDDSSAAVTDQRWLQESVDVFRKLPEFRHASPPFPRPASG